MTCVNHHDRKATYHAIYQRGDEESSCLYCDDCAAKKRALNSPNLTLNKLGKLSRTGKRLCAHCRKLATHEGNYHRSHGDPVCLYYCDEHACSVPDALPLAVLAIAIPGLQEALDNDVSAEDLCTELQRAGLGECTRSMAQDALWLRYPTKYCWSKQGYYVSATVARAERPQVGPRFQAMMNGLLSQQDREG